RKGKISQRIACESGMIGPPPRPWKMRATISVVRSGAAPERNELSTNSVVQIRKKRVRPKSPASHAVAGMITALAARVEVITHDTSSSRADIVACRCGRLLFDTGVHCQARVDPVGRLGPERVKRLTVKSEAGDDVIPQLARLGLGPGDVRYVANSHLHFDHCGGNEFFPRATFLVQRPELEAARRPGFVPSYSPSPIDFDHPLDYRMLDGEHDVF